MENEIQPNIPPTQPLPQIPSPILISSPTNWSKILLFTVLGLIIVVVSVVAGIKIGKNQTLRQQPITVQPTASSTQIATNPTVQPTTNPTNEPTIDWKTYKSIELGFLIKYPTNLTLQVKNNEVVINHNIPFKNSGDCDMVGGSNEYSTLDDFNLTFSVIGEPNIPTYAETIKIGKLDGKTALEGAEGCGDTYYYFRTPQNKTLIVKRANIQALSGISTAWDIKKILKTPGVISKNENERLFIQILSSLEFTSL